MQALSNLLTVYHVVCYYRPSSLFELPDNLKAKCPKAFVTTSAVWSDNQQALSSACLIEYVMSITFKDVPRTFPFLWLVAGETARG